MPEPQLPKAVAKKDIKTSSKEAEDFFARNSQLLSDYAKSTGFTFTQGDKWAINPQTGEATYDPTFFTNKDYTPQQALFASTHEVEHMRELYELLGQKGGQEVWDGVKKKTDASEGYQILDNCLWDIKDNKRVLSHFPALEADVRTLYQTKLFPQTDYTKHPLHLQLSYALLREAMLPDVSCNVDPKVRSAIDSLRQVAGNSGQRRDFIALISNPNINPAVRFQLIEKYIDPVFYEFYQEDLQNNGQNPHAFDKFYDEYKNGNPKPVAAKEIEEKVTERKKSAESDSSKFAKGYEKEHGVSQQDIADYHAEFQIIEPYVAPLRDIFSTIVEERSKPVRALTKIADEGVMIEPGLISQAVLDIEAGRENPLVMLDFEGNEIIENIPGNFRIRLVCDKSISMKGNKLQVQRQVGQLVLESLSEFSELVEKNRSSFSVDLDIQSEVVTFGNKDVTKVVKPLSSELSEKERIGVFKALSESAGTTTDFEALKIIEDEITAEMGKDPLYAAKVSENKLKEIILVLSDGDSDNAAEVQKRLSSLRRLGATVVGIGMTGDAKNITVTYAPDAKLCEDISQLPKVIQQVLAEQFAALSFRPSQFDTILGMIREE